MASLREEEVSYDVFMEKLQTLFGADGAKQILTQSEDGPLNMINIPEDQEGYKMSEMEAVFFG